MLLTIIKKEEKTQILTSLGKIYKNLKNRFKTAILRLS